MNRSTKAVAFPFALALALAGSNAMAERITAEQIYAELPAEIAQDGQKFMNPDQDSQLRHRVNQDAMPQGKTIRERKELQTQQNKKAKHQHQYKEMGSGQHKHQSGSFGAFSGRGSGGGGGRGR